MPASTHVPSAKSNFDKHQLTHLLTIVSGLLRQTSTRNGIHRQLHSRLQQLAVGAWATRVHSAWANTNIIVRTNLLLLTQSRQLGRNKQLVDLIVDAHLLARQSHINGWACGDGSARRWRGGALVP
jgi:hypothetical protein